METGIAVMALKEVTAQPRAREAAPRGVAMNVSESSSISEAVQDISWYKRHRRGHSVRMRTLDGGDIDVPPETIAGFKTRLRGPVLTDGDAGYEDSRTVWNAMIDRRPSLVVRCLGAADVMASVQFAREHRLLLCVKGGGHNIGGLATADGALMLDLSLMRGVWVDKRRNLAHARPDACWATSIAKHSCRDLPPCLASYRSREFRVSRLAEASGT
jgi:hypothetical protein